MYNTVVEYNILKHNLNTNGREYIIIMFGESFCICTE